jgi:hypothetical protein
MTYASKSCEDRYQKYNNHLRLRPEALAARIHRASQIESAFPHIGNKFSDLSNAIAPTVAMVTAFNSTSTALLPMAFQEGSPMHPSYGAGPKKSKSTCLTRVRFQRSQEIEIQVQTIEK